MACPDFRTIAADQEARKLARPNEAQAQRLAPARADDTDLSGEKMLRDALGGPYASIRKS